MQFVVYLAVLVTIAFSVALEWHTLVVPSGGVRREMHAITQAPPTRTVQTLPQIVPTDQTRVVHPAPTGAPAAQPAPIHAAAQPAQPLCDIAACTAAYFTFRASDCTYQPTDGPRRLCTKGKPPTAANAQDEAGAATLARCHRRACAEAYSSFNPEDCTYQPLDGPRRRCTK